MKSKNVDMLSESITKGLLSMSIPIKIMNVMQLMFNIIDMTVMKMAGQTTAVSAMGACGSLITLCTCLLIGVSTGATLIFMCISRFVWVYAVYPFLPNNFTFLYLIWPIGWVLSIVTLLVSYFMGISKLQKMQG